MSPSLRLLLVFTLAALPIRSADSPCETAGPPVVVDQGPTASPNNVNAIIGGSVAGGVAVAAGIGGLVAWEKNQNEATRRRRKDIGGGGGGSDNLCKAFTTQLACPLPGCAWDTIGAKCQPDTCTPFTTQLSCPSSGCLWDAIGFTCQQDTCSPFTTQSTCPLAGCEWDATGAKCMVGPLIEAKAVGDGNTTAAPSAYASASSGNPWAWVGLALLLCGLAICLAALLFFFCGSAAKKTKKSKRIVAAAAVEPAPEPEMVPLMEIPPLMAFAAPQQQYRMAPPVYTEVAAPATTVLPKAVAAPVYTGFESFAPVTTAIAAPEVISTNYATAVAAPVMYQTAAAAPVYAAAAPVMYETAVAAPMYSTVAAASVMQSAVASPMYSTAVAAPAMMAYAAPTAFAAPAPMAYAAATAVAAPAMTTYAVGTQATTAYAAPGLGTSYVV